MVESAALFIRLYLDEDVSSAVAAAMRRRGFDAVSVHEVGRRGRSDPEQLAYAAADDRTLFTFNAADFVQLHRKWITEGRPHGGIIVAEQALVGEIMRRLLKLLNSVTADEIRSQIYWLPSVR
jgi:predicted nuclease of predicted toxin-antitoxin system